MNVRKLKGFDNYSIDEYGNVFSFNKNRYLKPSIDKDGYVIITFSCDSKPKKFKVHRLVAELFLEDFTKEKQVNHKDFNKLNNHYSNLEMSDHRHNQNHKWNKNDTVRYGVFKHKDKWRSVLQVGKNKRKELGVSEDKEMLYQRFYEAYLNHYGIPPWGKNK